MTKLETKYDCPVCLGVKMSKMHVPEIRGLTIDFCSRCGGFWFDQGEVKMLHDYRPRSMLRRLELKKELFMMQCHSCHSRMGRNDEKCSNCDWKNVIDCPVCHRALKGVTYNNLKLDACHNCKGVWFDEIELAEIWNMNYNQMTQKARRGKDGKLVDIDGGEAAAIFLDVLWWNPGLISAGGEILSSAGGALANAGGAAVEGLSNLDLGNVADAAGGLVEGTGELAGSVFEAIANIIGEIFSSLDF